MSDLVIVESPAKAKTIKKYLGSGYEVVASMGHVRDLPKSRLSVDIKKNFAPKYEIIKGKEKLVDDLKSAAEKSEHIYLATDPDREGEAISWHLKDALGIDDKDYERIVFNEITSFLLGATFISKPTIFPSDIYKYLIFSISDKLLGILSIIEFKILSPSLNIS